MFRAIRLLALAGLLFLARGLAAEETCQVQRVTDGDSLALECGGRPVKVRLHCIDAPEMGQKPWGRQARDHLRGLVGRTVGLNRLDTDRYGRTVGVIWQGARNLNLQQVQDGAAAVYPQYCQDARYFQAETSAKSARRGIWNASGPHQTPWLWRERHRR